MTSGHDEQLTSEGLIRGLGRWDATLLTVGSVIGTGIFITTADIARVLPHQGMILLVWALAGVLTLAGALSYAELGAMFPSAGGHLPVPQGGLRHRSSDSCSAGPAS